MPSRLTLAAATLALAGSLAACSDDPQPRIGAAPSPTPTTTEPAEQAQAPKEVVRQWLELEVEMQNSGDSTTYRTATAGCQPCVDFADLIDGYYAAGGSVEVAGQRIVAVKEVPSVPEARVFEVRVDPEPTRFRVSADAAVERLPGDPFTFKVTLRQVDGRWQVSDYVQLAK